jgi:hypothetical protein
MYASLFIFFLSLFKNVLSAANITDSYISWEYGFWMINWEYVEGAGHGFRKPIQNFSRNTGFGMKIDSHSAPAFENVSIAAGLLVCSLCVEEGSRECMVIMLNCIHQLNILFKTTMFLKF